MRAFFNRKGQFSIIAAALVAIVLVTALIATYSVIQNNPLQERPEILGSIDEMNIALNHVLEFMTGYYGSILQVTGNTTYARELTSAYFRGSLESVAYKYAGWNPTFSIEQSTVTTAWFNRTSTTESALNMTYDLAGLGIYSIRYAATASLKTVVSPSSTNFIIVNVTRNWDEPYPNLVQNNFFVYNYSFADSKWDLLGELEVNSISSQESYSSYNITLPGNIDSESYMLQVVDTRGIRVTASTFSEYSYAFTWNEALYSSLNQDTIVVEALQNGTVRWLGQDLELATVGRPIPPVPVKALHLNHTVEGVSREVPFQIEDWESQYQVPCGMTSNASLFDNRQLIAFLVDHNVEAVTLWWDGRDIANQTSLAFTNQYFTGDDPESRRLTNGILYLDFSSSGFTVTSSIEGSNLTSTASFLRVNGEDPVYGASPAYVIHHGVVRDIVQQEAEWSGGIAGCPDVYGQIVLTLPANATYFTYKVRPIFVDSSHSRTINELSAISLTVSAGEPLTEDGTSGGYPVTSTASATFSNSSTPTGWAHHWSEFLSGNAGAGLMFPDRTNTLLYAFDGIASAKTGALDVRSVGRVVEFNPVEIASASFQHSLDLSWHGAVVSFDGTDPIYPESGNIGLWVIVESPPTVAVSASE
jgi:hypothetical protein